MKKLLYLLLMLPVWCFGQSDPAPSAPVAKPSTAYQQSDSTYIFQNGKWFHVINLAAGDARYAQLSGVVPGGLVLSVSGTTATVTAGSWVINGVTYSKGTTTNITIPAADATQSRYVDIYATTSSTILGVNGTLSLTPVEPDVPDNTVIIGVIFIQPSGPTIVPSTGKYVTNGGNQPNITGNKGWKGTQTFKNSVYFSKLPFIRPYNLPHFSLSGDTVVQDTVVYTPQRFLYGTNGDYFIGDTLNEASYLEIRPTADTSWILNSTGNSFNAYVFGNHNNTILSYAQNGKTQDIVEGGFAGFFVDNDFGLGLRYRAHPDFTTAGPQSIIDKQYADSLFSAGGGGLAPTNGLEKIATDSIGLCNGCILGHDVNISTNGGVSYFQIGDFSNDPNVLYLRNNSSILRANNIFNGAYSDFYLDNFGWKSEYISPTSQVVGIRNDNSGSPTSGIEVRDDINNNGMYDYIHHNYLGGTQLVEGQDIDSLATARGWGSGSSYTAGYGLGLTGTVFRADSTVLINGTHYNGIIPTWATNRYVPNSRTLTAGNGINTIGDLSANRTISADTSILTALAHYNGVIPTWATNRYQTKLTFDSTPTSSSTNPVTSGGVFTALAGKQNSVMTTLGDMNYGGASGVPTRLAGQTTIARGFLTQTESGGTSAAPAWFDLFGSSLLFSADVTMTGGTLVRNNGQGISTNAYLAMQNNTAASGPSSLQWCPGISSHASGWSTTGSTAIDLSGEIQFITFSAATGYGAYDFSNSSNGGTRIHFGYWDTNGLLRTKNLSTTSPLTGSAADSVVTHDATTNQLKVVPVSNFVTTSTGRIGQTTLVSGTKAISITGVTTSSLAFVTLVTPSGTSLTTQYQAVCTSGTLTIQANVAAGTINVADGSTINYQVIN